MPKYNGLLTSCRQYVYLFRTLIRELRGRRLEPEVAHMDRFLEPDSVCIQIGASDGRHGFYMARRLKSGCVHCLEPSPYSRQVLSKLRRLFGYDNIKIHGIGLSDVPKTAYLVTPVKANRHLGRAIAFVSDRLPDPDACDQAWGSPGFISQEIELDSLDNFCRREGIAKVDFIRCDVEGSEGKILAGAAETLRRDRPVLMIEIHPDALARWFASSSGEIWSILSGYDYKMFYLQDDGLVEAAKFFEEPCRDYFCVPREKLAHYGLGQEATAAD